MKTRSKIGFHLGPGGNADGFGDYLRQLDAAEIPAFVKSADSYGPCYEANNLAATSGVQHITVYRLSTAGQNDGYDYDVPDYNRPPEEAAELHWAKTVAKLPPEFDKRTWIEPINEVDKERADWLGRFAVYIANLANDGGYRVSLFAWSGGEPEKVHWQEPGMLDYLRLCASRPEQCAVALHEYSFEVDDIMARYPYLIGRFNLLHEVCDENGILRPTIHITEFGWTLNDVPHPDRAMTDIEVVGEIYAPHLNIQGGTIWYLGPGFGGIADKAQRLIAPVTQFTLEHWFDIDEPPPIEPPPGGECPGQPRTQYKREVWVYPNHATVAQREELHLLAATSQVTIGPSYDDAGLGDLNDKTAVLFGVDNEAEMRAWYQEHYPGTQLRFLPLPNGGPEPPIEPPLPGADALIGLHASADPGHLYGGEVEFAEFRTLQPGIIKILSAHSAESVGRLAAENQTVRQWIVRAFLDFGGRDISPQQFINDTRDDLLRAVDALHAQGVGNHEIAIEVHNEPNLQSEGLGSSWSNGTEFASWLLGVIEGYQALFPANALLYPGLSPGGGAPGKQDSTQFLFQSMDAVRVCQGVGVHAYWSIPNGFPMATAVQHVEEVADIVGNQPLIITEASENSRPSALTPDQYAADYVTFWASLNLIPTVRGVTYFVASASNPDFWPESWVVSGESRGIAQRIRELLPVGSRRVGIRRRRDKTV